MITRSFAMMESRLERIARIMTGRYDVKVTVRGSQAYVDLKTREIVLPVMTDLQAAKLEDLIDGFLDHECGHLNHTDPEVHSKDQTIHLFCNGLEDVRIEALQSRLIGVADNLRRLHAAITKGLDVSKADPLLRLLFALIHAWRGDAELRKFASDEGIAALVKVLDPEVRDGRRVASTTDCLDIATRVVAKVRELATAKDEPGSEKGEDSAGVNDSDDAEETDGASGKEDPSAKSGTDSGEDGGGAGGEADGDADGGSGGSPDADGADADDDAGGAEGEAPGDASESAPGRDSDAGDGAEAESGEVSPEELAAAKKAAKAIDKEVKSGKPHEPPTAESVLNGAIKSVLADEGGPKSYVVFSTEYDHEEKYTLEDRAQLTERYAQLRNEVRAYEGTMATQLELALFAKTQARWAGGEKRGKRFDRRQIAAWALGSEDDRIFLRKEEGERIDTAITMLWDCSGSMGMGRSGSSKSKAELARLAAIAFHEALLRCNVPHEVLGFTSHPRDPRLAALSNAAEKAGDDMKRYSRIDFATRHMVFVPFGQSDGRALCKLDAYAENLDGESLLWAAKRLAQRPETRKILIVGSDGEPAGARFAETERKHLREAVTRVMSAGLEIYGIGILSNSVKRYYPEWVVLNNAEELPRAVLNRLRESLAAQRGTKNGNSDRVA